MRELKRGDDILRFSENFVLKGNKLKFFSKSSERMEEIEDNTVSLIVTSPPYYNYKNYGIGIGNEKKYEDYLDNIAAVCKDYYRVIHPGGTVVINITNMKSRLKIEKKSFVYPIVADTIRIMQKLGFVFFDEIVWIKGHANNGALKGKPLFGSYPYPPTPKILDSIFENILVFRKPGKRSKVSKERKEKSKLSKEEWIEYTKGIWFIEPDRKAKHPATFPFEIPKRLVKLYSFVDDIVLDPFAGTGTTLIAAVSLGRRAIGYEINSRFRCEFEEKWNEYFKVAHL